jgi:hypothetical protein
VTANGDSGTISLFIDNGSSVARSALTPSRVPDVVIARTRATSSSLARQEFGAP